MESERVRFKQVTSSKEFLLNVTDDKTSLIKKISYWPMKPT